MDASKPPESGPEHSNGKKRGAESRNGTQKGVKAKSGSDDWGKSLSDIAKPIMEKIPSMYEGTRHLKHVADKIEHLSNSKRELLNENLAEAARRALKIGASDMDLGGEACGGKVWYRVDGKKRRSDEYPETSIRETDVLILNFLSPTEREDLFENGAIDRSFETKLPGGDGTGRFRATAYLDHDHLALNMRAIDDNLFGLDDLNIPPSICKGMMFKHVMSGLTLVTGVTGSGKSTTLDAIIDANNRDYPGHIVTIADPIEYMHKPKKCIVRHREVGRDVTTFKAGITQALRQDPDIVVIGEMRDPETIEAALEITDSGHKVFSTLHTSSAIETVDRIIAEVPTGEQRRIRNRLGDVLQCVISQKLLPKIGGGRQMAKEILWMDASSRAAIKNDNVEEVYQHMWEGGEKDELTLEQDLYQLAQARLIEPATALDYANNKKRLKRLF